MEKHSVADMPLHFLCRGWMKDEGEWNRRTLQTGVSKHVQTHRQQWERHTQAVRPNSAPLCSAAHLARLTSERTHFTKGSKVMSSQSGGWCVCVVMAEFVQAQCLHILYISTALQVCAYQCLSVSERIPLCVSCTISHREGRGGWQSARDHRGTVQAHSH